MSRKSIGFQLVIILSVVLSLFFVKSGDVFAQSCGGGGSYNVWTGNCMYDDYYEYSLCQMAESTSTDSCNWEGGSCLRYSETRINPCTQSGTICSTQNSVRTYTDSGCSVCYPNCSCASNTCSGSTCSDGCGGTCAGTRGSTNGTWSACNSSCTRTCNGASCGGSCPGSAPSCAVSGTYGPLPSCTLLCGQTVNATCTGALCGGTCTGVASGSCANNDNGGPTAPTLNGPYNGTSTSPYSASGTTATLSWTGTSSLTDYYRVYLINNTSGSTVWSNTNVTGTSVTTGTLSTGVLYRWYVVPVNNTCASYGGEDVGTASVNGYFMINTAPFIGSNPIVIINNPGTITIPSENMGSLGVSGNHICDTDFGGSRALRFQVTINDNDINGGSQINAVYLRLSNSGNIPMTIGVSGINGTPTTTISGSGGATWGSTPVTVGTAGANSRTVTFWVNLGNSFPNATYAMEIRGVDQYGGDSGWVNSNRYLRVWDCQVALSGNMYDSSNQAAGAVCSTGVGFDVLASPEMNFTQVRITRNSTLESTANAVGNNYYSGIGITWGQTYVVQPNDDLQASNVVTRWVGVGNNVLCGPSNQITESLVDPYSATPTLRIDFSAIRDQEPWFQVSGGGLFSKSSITEMIPETCALSSGCTPAMSISAGSATNGLVSAPSISNNSGCSLSGNCSYGNPKNWSYAGDVVNDNFGYDYIYGNYFAKLGLGFTIPTATTMSQIVSMTGGTGVVLVDGNVNITSNNTVNPGSFLMIVSSGTITIDQSVTRTEGILAADQGITAGGTNNTQLRINGILYSPTTIRLNRGYTTMVDNNDSPATLVSYRPDFIFNMPQRLSKILVSWSQGK